MNDTDIIARVVYRLCNLETGNLVDSQWLHDLQCDHDWLSTLRV